MINKVKPFILFAAVFVAAIAVDLIVKAVCEGVNSAFLPHIISIYSVHNYGIAWSMLSNAGVWLAIFTGLLTVAAVAVWVVLKKRNLRAARRGTLVDLGFAFFIGGALGNLIDRIFLGYVRDFLRLEFWPSFPIFNMADLFLNVGVVILAVYFLFFFDKERKNANNQG